MRAKKAEKLIESRCLNCTVYIDHLTDDIHDLYKFSLTVAAPRLATDEVSTVCQTHEEAVLKAEKFAADHEGTVVDRSLTTTRMPTKVEAMKQMLEALESAQEMLKLNACEIGKVDDAIRVAKIVLK